MNQQPLPVVHRLAPANVERGQACFLKALVGIGPIAQQPVCCPPGHWAVPAQNHLPVGHECLPPTWLLSIIKSFETAFFLQADPEDSGPRRCSQEPRRHCNAWREHEAFHQEPLDFEGAEHSARSHERADTSLTPSYLHERRATRNAQDFPAGCIAGRIPGRTLILTVPGYAPGRPS